MKRIIPCVVITLFMMLAGSFLPLFGFFGLMLCPLPLGVLGCIEGRKSMSVAELMIEATLFLAVSPTLAAYFLLGCAPVSASLFALSQESFRDAKKLSGGESVIICAGASVVFKTILIAAFWFFTGKNIMFPDAAQMGEALTQMYGEQPELKATLRQIMTIFPHMLPSMLVLYAVIESYLNYSLCFNVIRKFFPDTKNYPPELPAFKLWKFPASLFFASLGGFLLGLFVDIDTWFEGAMFILNLQIVANVLMFIQGFSVAVWIMDGFKLRKSAKILLCCVLSVPFFWPWLIVVGMCEMTISLRERIKFKGD